MSPLTPLIETEMLIAAIAANITFLQTLTGLPELDIDADELTELSDQAHQHFEHATRWHRRLRVDAFTSSA